MAVREVRKQIDPLRRQITANFDHDEVFEIQRATMEMIDYHSVKVWHVIEVEDSRCHLELGLADTANLLTNNNAPEGGLVDPADGLTVGGWMGDTVVKLFNSGVTPILPGDRWKIHKYTRGEIPFKLATYLLEIRSAGFLGNGRQWGTANIKQYTVWPRLADVVYPTNFRVTPSFFSIQEEQEKTLALNFLPSDTTETLVIWSSSDPSVAIATSNNTIYGNGEGTAQLTAITSNGLIATVTATITRKPVPVTGVSIQTAPFNLLVGETATLTAEVLPIGCDNSAVTWSSSDPSVIAVSSLGVVTAIADGSATITVTTVDGGFTDTILISAAAYVPATTVTLNKNTVEIDIQETEALTATVSPANATYPEKEWESSDPTVATVTQDGVVFGVAPGTATVTVWLPRYPSIMDSCAVDVVQGILYPDVVQLETMRGTISWTGGTHNANVLLSPRALCVTYPERWLPCWIWTRQAAPTVQLWTPIFDMRFVTGEAGVATGFSDSWIVSNSRVRFNDTSVYHHNSVNDFWGDPEVYAPYNRSVGNFSATYSGGVVRNHGFRWIRWRLADNTLMEGLLPTTVATRTSFPLQAGDPFYEAGVMEHIPPGTYNILSTTVIT